VHGSSRLAAGDDQCLDSMHVQSVTGARACREIAYTAGAVTVLPNMLSIEGSVGSLSGRMQEVMLARVSIPRGPPAFIRTWLAVAAASNCYKHVNVCDMESDIEGTVTLVPCQAGCT